MDLITKARNNRLLQVIFFIISLIMGSVSGTQFASVANPPPNAVEDQTPEAAFDLGAFNSFIASLWGGGSLMSLFATFLVGPRGIGSIRGGVAGIGEAVRARGGLDPIARFGLVVSTGQGAIELSGGKPEIIEKATGWMEAATDDAKAQLLAKYMPPPQPVIEPYTAAKKT